MRDRRCPLPCFALAATLLLGGCPKKEEKAGPVTEETSAVKPKPHIPSPPARPRPAPKKPSIGSKDRTRIPSGGAEKSPHPDFPTPSLARTDKIFLLEEPDRGPLVTSAKVPAARGLRWSSFGHCEQGYDTVHCGRRLRGGGGPRLHWRLGYKGRRLAVAQERFGPRVLETLLLERNAGGKLARMVLLDSRGVVEWSRHFNGDATRYSSRALGGGNKLPGCGYIQLARDGRGRIKQASCLQWSGEPMLNTLGAASTRFKRDARGLVLERAYLDREGKPVNARSGVHRTIYKRDRQGRRLRLRTLDSAGFPALDADGGCHGWSYSHDRAGLQTSRSCLDKAGKPALDANSVCRYEYTYNGRGCLTSTTNFKLASKGRCTWRLKKFAYQVNEHCERLVRTCFGRRDGDRIACGLSQAAEFRYSRDNKGRVVSTKHFRADLQPGKDVNCEAFESRKQWDERGHAVRDTFHGTAGQPVECKGTGYHGVVNTHDDAGRTSEERFLSLTGKPGTNLGCSLRRFRHDNYDHLSQTTNYDAEGKVMNVLGMAVKKYIYDEAHRKFGMLLLDAKQQPARYRGCFTGKSCPGKPWHAVRIVREPNGEVSRNLFFDAEQQLLKVHDCAKKRCWE